ncbi:MAG: hypothetical protein NTV68_05305 [Methanomicrobiales archaeon]|nr:hypothetical protein [Methanomicrobiales archaeon]
MGKRNSLQMVNVVIKADSVPIVNQALKTCKGPGLTPIRYFLSRAIIDCQGTLIFKESEDAEDPYCSFDDGTTIALFGTWDEHEKIASWVKLHSEKGGKMVLFSYDGDGAAWGWEFDGKGRMRELQYRNIMKYEYHQTDRIQDQIRAVDKLIKVLNR